jgi:hypothetical protein
MKCFDVDSECVRVRGEVGAAVGQYVIATKEKNRKRRNTSNTQTFGHHTFSWQRALMGCCWCTCSKGGAGQRKNANRLCAEGGQGK